MLYARRHYNSFPVSVSFSSSLLPIHPRTHRNKDIYAFLDELAAEKIITLTDAVKPWSKAFIASRLSEADNNRDRLSRRCRNET
jgi:hypothetical protein